MASYRQTTAFRHDKYGGIPATADNRFTWDYIQTQIPLYSDIQKSRSQHEYYKDYYRNTGIAPRYPYLTYADYTTPALYSALGMASHVGYKLLTPNRLYG